MNIIRWYQIAYIVVGFLDLAYSISCKNKINYNIRAYSKRHKMIIVNPKEFFRLQLIFLVFSSMIIITYGILQLVFNWGVPYIIFGVIPFYNSSLILMMKGKQKGYIDYEVGETYK